MSTERDDLAEVIWDEGACDWRQEGPNEVAAAILAAGYRKPRTVTTVEEVETLFQSEANVVLLDSDGLVLQNLYGGWLSPTFNESQFLTSPDLHRLFGPEFTVLHEVTA